MSRMIAVLVLVVVATALIACTPRQIVVPVTTIEIEVTREVPILPNDVLDLCADFPYMLTLAQRHLEYLNLFKDRRDAPGVDTEDIETIFYNL